MTYEPLFPYDVVEILNGILGPALLWMTLFLIIHLKRQWTGTRMRFRGVGGIFRATVQMHRYFKPEIALFTIVSALCIRTFVLWYVRWLKNNDINWNDFVTNFSGEILIALTAIIIVGVACWVRVILPMQGRPAIALWSFMVASSIAFGVGMHYVF